MATINRMDYSNVCEMLIKQQVSLVETGAFVLVILACGTVFYEIFPSVLCEKRLFSS